MTKSEARLHLVLLGYSPQPTSEPFEWEAWLYKNTLLIKVYIYENSIAIYKPKSSIAPVKERWPFQKGIDYLIEFTNDL